MKHIENQGSVHDSLTSVTKELCAKALLQHKDKGVRILTACCLAETLRLHAPTVPFDQNSLKVITFFLFGVRTFFYSTNCLQSVFQLFFQQLPNLCDAKHPFFALCYELLECLNTAKSVTLVAELSVDDLVIDFFEDLFKSLRPEMSQSVIACLLDLLQQLIEDSQFLHRDVIEILLLQLSPSQKIKSPTAHHIACDLCQATADKLQRYVCQYFSDILVAAGKEMADDANPEQFRAAHRLILEIYNAAPDILLNVIPQLEEELKVDSLPMRTLALTSLGEMFLLSGPNLVRIYPQVWKAWNDRRNDKAVSVRTEWVCYCAWIVKKHPQIYSDIEAGLQQKLLDPDEKVRIESIKAFGTILSESPHLANEQALKQLAMRCRDKKNAVRNEAIEVVSALFNHFMTVVQRSESCDAENPDVTLLSRSVFQWLAGDLIELLYINDPETTVMVEKAVFTQIFPPEVADMDRTKRTLLVLRSLTEKQYKAFVSILNRQARNIYEMELFITQCDAFNGGIMDANEESIQAGLSALVLHMASFLADPKKVQTHLHKFANINDRRAYQLMRSIMNPHNEYKKISRDHKELIKRLEPHGAQFTETFQILTRRSSLALVGRTTIETLMQLLQNIRRGLEGAVELKDTAKKLMKDVSEQFPAVYKTLVAGFVQTIEKESDETVSDALEALARYLKSFPAEAPTSATIVSKLKRIATKSESADEMKNAMVVLAQGKRGDVCKEIVEHHMKALLWDEPLLFARIGCLKAAAHYAYEAAYRDHMVSIINFVVKHVLLVNHKAPDEDAADWVEYKDLDERTSKVKILSLKLAVKPLLTMGTTAGDGDKDTARLDLAKSVLKLLRTVLDNSGELVSGEFETDVTTRTHLRLTAGICLLKMARHSELRKLIAPLDLVRLSLLVQDPVFFVRNAFVTRLCGLIQSGQVPTEYVTMLMLIAHEPDTILKSQVRSFLIRRAKQLRSVDDVTKSPLVENTFGHFLHLISHHPDFSVTEEDLETTESYVQLFLDTVATSDNIGLLYCIASRLKMVRDKHVDQEEAEGRGGATNLYIVSEMAQVLIHDRASSNSWTLQSWPGRVPLSSRLFEHLGSNEASTNLKKQYLDQDYIKERANRTRTPLRRGANSSMISSDLSMRASGAFSPMRTPSSATRYYQHSVGNQQGSSGGKRRKKSSMAMMGATRRGSSVSMGGKKGNVSEEDEEEEEVADEDTDAEDLATVYARNYKQRLNEAKENETNAMNVDGGAVRRSDRIKGGISSKDEQPLSPSTSSSVIASN